MISNRSINIKYHFEKVPETRSILSGNISTLGNVIKEIFQTSPYLIPDLSFGKNEYLKGSPLDPDIINNQPVFAQKSDILRIRSIKHEGETLVEYFYDNEGRLIKVELIGSRTEEYVWADDGKLLTVIYDNAKNTTFKYNEAGFLVSIEYPDESVYNYEYNSYNQLSSIIYPDGKSVIYTRNDIGYLTKAKFSDFVFEYSWDENNILRELNYYDSTGNWKIKPFEINKNIRMDLSEFKTDSALHVSSVIGSWFYGGKGESLDEMFYVTGERFKKINTDANKVISWSANGQTIHHLDDRKLLTGLINTDGTQTVIKTCPTKNCVFIVSASGVDILKYDSNGNLVAERDHQNNGFTYKYDAQQKLRQIKSANGFINIEWHWEDRLKTINLGDDLSASIKCKSTLPEQISSYVLPEGFMNTIENITRFIWNWESMILARRLHDPNFKM